MEQTGLLCCKQENVPSPGEQVWLTDEPAKGRESGKDYTRFRRNTAEYGGSLRTVQSAELTGRSDEHNNVWVNLKVSSTEGAGAAGSGQPSGGAAPASSNRDKDIAFAGTFNAAVTMTAAQLQTAAITPEQVIPTVEEWMQKLAPLRGAELPAAPAGNGQPPQGGEQAQPDPQQQGEQAATQQPAQPKTDDDIPF